MDKGDLYFLKISGYIHAGKHREFEQTVKFLFNQLPGENLERNLALDVTHSNLYHIYSLWQSEKSLLAFKASHEYKLLEGAFQTLGEYQVTMSGKMAIVQLFEFNYLDS
jgi:hypothetical protein